MAADDDEVRAARRDAIDRLLASTSPHRLIVAGPGTGKTFAFQREVEHLDARALVLTFLVSLVRELHATFGDKVDVYSFHGFSRRLLHEIDVTGVTRSVRYYPPLVDLLIEDISIVDGIHIDRFALGSLFRNLADDDPRLQRALESGQYYDAVAHDDAVYRVLHAIEADPSRLPSYGELLVDEYQDFCPLEVAFIQVLTRRMPSLIVGDDDQALYAFRSATPEAIRSMAADRSVARFDLPYCTRCTEVVVAATHRVVGQAAALGLLRGRIEKPYECYLPEKRADSERYPRIVHAHCSTNTRQAPYIAKYVDRAIGEIPPEEVRESHEKKQPTVLIIGPNPFLRQVEEYLRARRPNVVHFSSDEPVLDVRDAYRCLALDPESNLGWRILIQVLNPRDWRTYTREGLVTGRPLVEILPASFLEEQQHVAALFGRARDEAELSGEEQERLASALGCSVEELEHRVNPPAVEPQVIDDDQPTIMFTSLMGSKGLQASHVFILGVNEAHFPHNNDAVTDEEVCQLLVALTRTRKRCTVVSAGRLGAGWLRESRFVDWLRPLLEEVRVDKQYLEGLKSA